MRKRARIGLLVANLLVVVGFGLVACDTVLVWYLWPHNIDFDPYACIPEPEFVHGRLTVPYTDGYPVSIVLSSEDELRTALYFQFLRGKTAADGARVWFTAVRTPKGPVYQIILVGQGDWLADVARLGQLEGRRLIPRSDYVTWSQTEYARAAHQSQIFEAAYNRVPTGPERRVLRGDAIHLAAHSLVLLRYGEDRRLKRQEPRVTERR